MSFATPFRAGFSLLSARDKTFMNFDAFEMLPFDLTDAGLQMAFYYHFPPKRQKVGPPFRTVSGIHFWPLETRFT